MARWALIAVGTLWLLPAAAQAKDELCTFGVDCYCDCVTGQDRGDGFASDACKSLGPAGVRVDRNVIWCDDFENPGYEQENPWFGSEWQKRYSARTSACQSGVVEGPQSTCINILHDPQSQRYNANDQDFNCDKPGFKDCVFQGHQSLGEVVRNGSRGGQPGEFPMPRTGTFSLTFAIRYSDNWVCTANTCKGDRLQGASGQPSVPWGGGKISMTQAGNVCRGPTDGGRQIPFAASFLNRDWCTSPDGTGAGIDNRCQCTTDDCFSNAATRIGGECHKGGNQSGRTIYFAPAKADYDWATPGGIPNSTEGDGDGRGEWMCVQWSIANIGTNDMDYRFWLNNELLINAEGVKGAKLNKPTEYQLLSLFTSSQNTGSDMIRARDNFHLTGSATPIPCEQIGFDFQGGSQPPPPPPPPSSEPLGAPGQPVVVAP